MQEKSRSMVEITSGTRTKRRQTDAPLCGRSMVEMLGVLAIIGVLSVGAMNGYAKAMFKYKLNKQAEAISTLINYGLQYKDKLDRDEGKVTYYNEIFYKLGLIPDGIKYVNKSTLYDNFNNHLYVYYNNQKYETDDGQTRQNNFGGVIYVFDPSPHGIEICRNLVNVAKENSQDLWQVETYKSYNDSEDFTIHGNIYGDNYCKNNSTLKCLRNLSWNDLSELCEVCDEQPCQLIILWK